MAAKDNEIVEAELIEDAGKTVPYQITGYSNPRPPLHYEQQQRYTPVQPPTTPLAYVSVLFAILAVPFFWALLPAPIAALTGYLALKKIGDGEASGYRIARFGMIAGLIEIGIAVLVVVIMAIFAVVSWQTNPNTTKLF